jgi:hypothetical protein
VPALTSRIRWLIGGGAVVAAVAIVAGAIIVLGARPTPAAVTYVPRDSDVVAELRPDFPGDQLSKVGNLLAHFPGYKDQSILGQKIDETLAKITRSASNGSVDYSTQVKPWLSGPLYAGLDLSSTVSGDGPNWVVVFTTDGHVACDPIMNGSTATESYRGLEIHTPAPAAMSGAACVLDGRQAVVGNLVWVKTALDAHATGQGIDGVADYQAARARLGADRLATVYVARGAMTGRLEAGALAGGLATLDPALAGALDALPAWVIAGVRAEDNAIVADVVSATYSPSAAIPGVSLAPGASLLSAPPAHASQVVTLLPPDTALVYEIHGTGVALQNLLTEVRSMPELGAQLGQLDAALGTLGGVPSLVGWIGDTDVVVMPDGSSVTGGLVLLAPDEATATAKAGQLAGLLRLSGLLGSANVSVTETTIDGTPVTLADFGDVGSLLGPGGVGGLGGMTVPPATHLVVSIAAHGSTVLIGSGESFVRRIVETAKGASLADQASYKTAMALASAHNDSQVYVAAGPVLALVEANLPPADKARYESDVKPYLAPFDAILETTTSDASGLRIRLVVTVH